MRSYVRLTRWVEWAESELAEVDQEKALLAGYYLRSRPQLVLTGGQGTRVYAEMGGSVSKGRQRILPLGCRLAYKNANRAMAHGGENADGW